MKIRFIGDVHGHFEEYNELIRIACPTIQVGDLGVGFGGERKLKMAPKDRFINGNHDNPTLCRDHPNFIAPTDSYHGVYAVGGGYSIDKHIRTPGLDWWPDEELSYATLCEVIDDYECNKPSTVVTHEPPAFLARSLCDAIGSRTVYPSSRTSMAFQKMFELHVPKLWVFGHWHTSWRAEISGCQFICLDILQTVDLDTGDYA